MHSRSYTELSAQKVREMCCLAMANVDKARAVSDRNFVETRLENANRWRRFIPGLKPLTFEQMDARTASYWERGWRQGYIGAETWETAKKLRALAFHGDPVYVTAEDMDHLLNLRNGW